MRTAVFPGSFDPVTNGHLDIIARASALFDEVVVAVLVNPAKTTLFPLEQRLELLRNSVASGGYVTVTRFDGLLVDFCASRAGSVLVRGLRASGDLDKELAMAAMNRHLSGVETLLLPAAAQWFFVASSLVKEVVSHGGDATGLVPEPVLAALTSRFSAPRPDPVS